MRPAVVPVVQRKCKAGNERYLTSAYVRRWVSNTYTTCTVLEYWFFSSFALGTIHRTLFDTIPCQLLHCWSTDDRNCWSDSKQKLYQKKWTTAKTREANYMIISLMAENCLFYSLKGNSFPQTRNTSTTKEREMVSTKLMFQMECWVISSSHVSIHLSPYLPVSRSA